MRGLCGCSTIQGWLAALALAAGAVLAVNPLSAASAQRGGPAMSPSIARQVRRSAVLTAAMAREAVRTPEASVAARPETQGNVSESLPANLRDPFKAPEPPPTGSVSKGKRSHLPPVLPPGVRGLLIDQLVLEGVVDKMPNNTMIAVVTNKTNRAYFLRVNQQVFDGTVTLITPAALYFRQNYYTPDDKVAWRTVEKRLSASTEGTK